MKKYTKTEKAQRRQALVKIDQESEPVNHNYSLGSRSYLNDLFGEVPYSFIRYLRKLNRGLRK